MSKENPPTNFVEKEKKRREQTSHTQRASGRSLANDPTTKSEAKSGDSDKTKDADYSSQTQKIEQAGKTHAEKLNPEKAANDPQIQELKEKRSRINEKLSTQNTQQKVENHDKEKASQTPKGIHKENHLEANVPAQGKGEVKKDTKSEGKNGLVDKTNTDSSQQKSTTDQCPKSKKSRIADKLSKVSSAIKKSVPTKVKAPSKDK